MHTGETMAAADVTTAETGVAAETAARVPAETAGMTAAESSVATASKTTSVATTAAVASPAMLGPNGHSKRKRERRNGNQATHTTRIITLLGKPGAVFWDS